MAKTYDIDIDINADASDIEVAAQKLKSLEDNVRRLKNEKIQQKIDVDTAKLEDANKRMDDLKNFLDVAKSGANIPINITDNDIRKAEAELDSLEQKQVDLQLAVESSKLKQAQAEVEELDGKVATVKVDVEGEEQVGNVGQEASGMAGKLIGVAGAIGVADQATKMWEASTQRQTTQFYLGANLGTQKAKEMQRSIQDIVSQVPGDDTFMNTVLSGALAKQTNMTTQDLSRQASVMADYLAGSEMQGKNAIEAQQDMKSYILSGSTAELERSSIVSNQVDKLKDKATVQERIQALEEALTAESMKGISNYDTAANNLTEFQGRLEKARADWGDVFLPLEQGALKAALSFDENLGGGLSMAITGLMTGVPAAAAAITGLGEASHGLRAIKDGVKWFKELDIITKLTSLDFLGLGAAEGVALWPILAIIAAVAALIVAWEQFGEYMGWWTDFGSMLESVKAGVLRLWDAFTNSRLVKLAIEGITSAFNSLKAFLTPLFDWIGSAFNDLFNGEGSGGGGFDIVGMWIDNFTMLEDIILQIIPIIQSIVTPIWNIMTTWALVASGQISIIDGIKNAFMNLFTFQQTIAGLIANAVLSLLSMLIGAVGNALNSIFTRIGVWAAGIVSRARSAASNFVNGVINGLTSLPSRFGNALQGVINVVTNWGTGLLNKANEIINQFKQTIENGINQVKSWAGLGVSYEGTNYSGVGYSGFNTGNTLNRTISTSASSNNSSNTVNLNLSGIIDKDASTYIVDAVNDHVKKNNLIRGV